MHKRANCAFLSPLFFHEMPHRAQKSEETSLPWHCFLRSCSIFVPQRRLPRTANTDWRCPEANSRGPVLQCASQCEILLLERWQKSNTKNEGTRTAENFSLSAANSTKSCQQNERNALNAERDKTQKCTPPPSVYTFIPRTLAGAARRWSPIVRREETDSIFMPLGAQFQLGQNRKFLLL